MLIALCNTFSCENDYEGARRKIYASTGILGFALIIIGTLGCTSVFPQLADVSVVLPGCFVGTGLVILVASLYLYPPSDSDEEELDSTSSTPKSPTWEESIPKKTALPIKEAEPIEKPDVILTEVKVAALYSPALINVDRKQIPLRSRALIKGLKEALPHDKYRLWGNKYYNACLDGFTTKRAREELLRMPEFIIGLYECQELFKIHFEREALEHIHVQITETIQYLESIADQNVAVLEILPLKQESDFSGYLHRKKHNDYGGFMWALNVAYTTLNHKDPNWPNEGILIDNETAKRWPQAAFQWRHICGEIQQKPLEDSTKKTILNGWSELMQLMKKDPLQMDLQELAQAIVQTPYLLHPEVIKSLFGSGQTLSLYPILQDLSLIVKIKNTTVSLKDILNAVCGILEKTPVDSSNSAAAEVLSILIYYSS